jgi:hypothetical protein
VLKLKAVHVISNHTIKSRTFSSQPDNTPTVLKHGVNPLYLSRLFIIQLITQINEEVLDSCWITFGKPMYATNVEVINDGVKDGVGSVFYSLAAKSNLPKIDYFGYGWKEEHNINMLVLDMGCLEEFGGWFTSLNIQYLGNDGHWYDVGKFKSTPALPETDIVFFQPPFAQYVLEFPAVKTKGIRVLMDAKVQEHWHKYTKNVSSFISITELGVYEK